MQKDPAVASFLLASWGRARQVQNPLGMLWLLHVESSVALGLLRLHKECVILNRGFYIKQPELGGREGESDLDVSRCHGPLALQIRVIFLHQIPLAL